MISSEATPRVTEVDGVATVWADVPGPFRAGLMIRVGTADETATVSGVTHLLEHLALFGIGRPGDHSNGVTDQTTTMFHAVGDSTQVTTFLADVTRQLDDPPLHRLQAERDVLSAEQAGRSRGIEQNLLTWRYGAQTYGVGGLGEIGRGALDEGDIRRWAARFANRRNAVLWLTGPPPAGLRLHLPDGDAQPAPDPSATILPAFPAFFTGSKDLVALHTVLPRGYVNQALTSVLNGRLIDELRTRRAVAYSPQVDYRPLTGETGRLLMVSDLVAGRQSDGVRPFLAALHDLAVDDAVRPEELEAWHTQVALMEADPHAAMGPLSTAAWETLFGRPVDDPEAKRAAIDAIGPDDVVASARIALSQALAQIPSGVRVTRDPWVPAPTTTAEPITGRQNAHLPADVHDRLEASDEGITLRSSEGDVTVRREGVAAVLSWADGRRVLIGDDAVRIVIEPTQWVDGDQVVADVDRIWPDECRIDMGSRRADEIPSPPATAAPASAVTPAHVELRRARLKVWALIVLATLLLAIGAGLDGSLVSALLRGTGLGIGITAVIDYRKRRAAILSR